MFLVRDVGHPAAEPIVSVFCSGHHCSGTVASNDRLAGTKKTRHMAGLSVFLVAGGRIWSFYATVEIAGQGVAQCPYMDSPSFASKLYWQAWHDCIRIFGLISWRSYVDAGP